jgi:hypothetical protein
MRVCCAELAPRLVWIERALYSIALYSERNGRFECVAAAAPCERGPRPAVCKVTANRGAMAAAASHFRVGQTRLCPIRVVCCFKLLRSRKTQSESPNLYPPRSSEDDGAAKLAQFHPSPLARNPNGNHTLDEHTGLGRAGGPPAAGGQTGCLSLSGV